MNRRVDVLVVGAGPTGSTAAKYASLRGADVLLIEKRSEIGTPVRCGEGVAKRWLEEIGLTPSPEFICHEVDGARIIAPDGTTLVLDETRAGNECGYILERDLFDRFLAREAAKAGADIMIKTSAVALLREDGRVVGARCEHMGETFDVHADVVIGADGFELEGTLMDKRAVARLVLDAVAERRTRTHRHPFVLERRLQRGDLAKRRRPHDEHGRADEQAEHPVGDQRHGRGT